MNGYLGKSLFHGASLALISLAIQGKLQAQSLELTGTYTVPKGAYMDQPLELAAPSVCWDVAADGIVSLQYELPYEIVGIHAGPIRLQSISASQPLRLRGDIAEGVCRNLPDQKISCTLTYKKNEEGVFPIDIEAGLAHMQSLQLGPATIASIREAQESLMHEAVGILVFRLP